MAEIEYDKNYAAWLTAAGITPATDPINLRGVVKQILAQLAPSSGAFAPTENPAGITGLSNPYDASRSVYNQTAAGMTTVRAALAKAFSATGLGRIYCAGDSVTWGNFSVPSTQSYPVYLRKILASLGYTISGTGFVTPYADGTPNTIDARFVFSPDNPQPGVGSHWLANEYTQVGVYSETDGDYVTFTSDLPGTSVVMYYLNAGGGSWTYNIDGAGAVTVNNGTNYAYSKVTVSGLANSTHTVVLTNTSANSTAGVWCQGIEVVGAEGVSVSNLGVPGITSAGWVTNAGGYDPLGNLLGLPAASLTFLCLGINDANTGVTPAAYTANMRSIITSIRGSGSEVVLVVPMTPAVPSDGQATSIPAATWLTFRQAMYSIADSVTGLNLPLIDLSDRGGTWAIANANGLMESAGNGDGFHPIPPGYAYMAQGVADLLLA